MRTETKGVEQSIYVPRERFYSENHTEDQGFVLQSIRAVTEENFKSVHCRRKGGWRVDKAS